MEQSPIIVIGAGITGVSTAEHLRRGGFSVTLIDPHPPGDPNQASFGNAGLLARAAITPVSEPTTVLQIPKMLFGRNSPLSLKWRYLPQLIPWIIPFLRNGLPGKYREIVAALDAIAHDTVDQHLLLARGTKAEALIDTGVLTYLYPRKSDYKKNSLGNRLKAEMGCDYDALDLDALREVDPNLGTNYHFGTAYKFNGWINNPAEYLRLLFEHFLEQGGAFEQAKVASIDGRRVELSTGAVIEADQIVLATGHAAGALAKQLDTKAPVIGERGYHIMVSDANFIPPNPYIVTDIRCGLTPMGDHIRVAGTTEFAPADSPPTKGRTDLLRLGLRRVYPTLNWSKDTEWLGHRPSTPDSLPMIGRLKTNRHVICAFGAQHLGLTLGPKTGALVAQIAAERAPNIDLSPFDANRFS